LGFIPPAELFAKIDVLVVPSLWHEPLGRIVFEAYAHGLPVIATDRGGISEIVSPGETGFLFDPDVPESDERSLERTITAFKQHADTKVMRQHALAKAKDFLPHVIVEQHEALYERVLKSKDS
jgi:glycosyltransferase involved in cell wall biosynthesis